MIPGVGLGLIVSIGLISLGFPIHVPVLTGVVMIVMWAVTV
jgi:hypothetical protein